MKYIWLWLIVVILVIFIYPKLKKSPDQPDWAQKSYASNQIAKIKVTAAGQLYINKEPATFEEVTKELQRVKELEGIVWYYRENGEQDPTSEQMPIVQALVEKVVELKLPVAIQRYDFQ